MEQSGLANRKEKALPVACLLAVSCVLLGFGSPAAAGKASAPSPDARVMTSGELFMLYRDKSWQWADGAGRMEADERRFTAWTGSGDGATWAEGRWILTDGGRLCFKAKWHSASGVAPNKTCFGHKKLGNVIYQRKEPSGAWYVFRHAKPTAYDEFHKLVSQDLVASDLERIKSKLDLARQTSDANLNTNQ
jgi:Protein of unknown function (DUF995)